MYFDDEIRQQSLSQQYLIQLYMFSKFNIKGEYNVSNIPNILSLKVLYYSKEWFIAIKIGKLC